MAEALFQDKVVDTEWISERLHDPRIRIVEIVWGVSSVFGRLAYETKHIPGAIAWDFEKDLQDAARQDVVDKAGLEALL